MLENWLPVIGGSAYQVKWDRLYNRCFDNSKINNFFDTSSFKDTLTTLAGCLSEFIDNPCFTAIDWGAEAKKDRLTGEWTPLSEINGVKQKVKYFLMRIGLYK
jgi:hypothetical protein